MDKEKCDYLLENSEFTFAKSMPNLPHSYIVKEEWGNDTEFEDLVLFIRENGVTERFFSKTYIYYHLNGYKYWTMGNQVGVTRIINRAKVEIESL